MASDGSYDWSGWRRQWQHFVRLEWWPCYDTKEKQKMAGASYGKHLAIRICLVSSWRLHAYCACINDRAVFLSQNKLWFVMVLVFLNFLGALSVLPTHQKKSRCGEPGSDCCNSLAKALGDVCSQNSVVALQSVLHCALNLFSLAQCRCHSLIHLFSIDTLV